MPSIMVERITLGGKAVTGKLDVNKLTSNKLMMCDKETLVDFIEELKEEKEELKKENDKLKEEKEKLKEEEKVKKIKRKEWGEKMIDRDLRLTLFAGEIHCYMFGGEPTEMDFHNLDFDAIVDRLKYFKEQMRNLYEENQELTSRLENSQPDLDFLHNAKVTVMSEE